MKNANFELDDDENLEDKIEKINIINQNNKSNIKANKSDVTMKKKKKIGLKKEFNETSKNDNIPFEEQEIIEFVLMDFQQLEELNKFTNVKSLSLVQQNIKSINVNKFFNFKFFDLCKKIN